MAAKVFIGSNRVKKVFVGSNEIKKIYVGNNLVYQNKLEPIYYYLGDTASKNFYVPAGYTTLEYNFWAYDGYSATMEGQINVNYTNKVNINEDIHTSGGWERSGTVTVSAGAYIDVYINTSGMFTGAGVTLTLT